MTTKAIFVCEACGKRMEADNGKAARAEGWRYAPLSAGWLCPTCIKIETAEADEESLPSGMFH